MGKLDDILWKLSPMGKMESILKAAFNSFEKIIKGELPETKDLIKIASTGLDVETDKSNIDAVNDLSDNVDKKDLINHVSVNSETDNC